MTFISRNRIFRIGAHTSQAERWISEGAALAAVVDRCTSDGTPMMILATWVRGPLARRCGEWLEVAPVSALVLRRTAGGPHLPPGPLPIPHGERKGERGGAGAKASWPPHAMVGDARYEPHATAGFWIRRSYESSRTVDQRGGSTLCCGVPMHQRRNTNDDPRHLGTRASGPLVRRLVGSCTGVSVGAAAHGWCALTFPLTPFRSHTGRGRGDVGGLVRTHGGPRTQWSEMHGTSLMQQPGF